jgi:3-methyladenine DNA glycosylase Mpg
MQRLIATASGNRHAHRYVSDRCSDANRVAISRRRSAFDFVGTTYVYVTYGDSESASMLLKSGYVSHGNSTLVGDSIILIASVHMITRHVNLLV